MRFYVLLKNTLIGLILFISSFSFSQNKTKDYKNSINIDPFVSIFGTVQIEYERKLNKNMSIGLAFGGKISSGVFRISGINSNRIKTEDFNFKGIKIIPEFRWYIEGRGVKGFYTGIYYRYLDYKSDFIGNYIDSNSESNNINMQAKVNSNTIGIQLGYKLIIINRFFIDFLIAGPGVSFNTFKIKEITPIPDEFYDDLSNAISNYGFFENLDVNFKIDINKKTETIVLPAFRYGIKFGFSF